MVRIIASDASTGTVLDICSAPDVDADAYFHDVIIDNVPNATAWLYSDVVTVLDFSDCYDFADAMLARLDIADAAARLAAHAEWSTLASDLVVIGGGK